MKRFAVALITVAACLAAIPEPDKGKVTGNMTAPIRIEIFSDFTCPHCKVMHEQTVPLLVKDYVNSNKAYIVDRAFPLTGPGHQFSREAFGYAVAAARIGKYGPVADVLYAKQLQWALNGNVWEAVAPVLSPTEQKKVKDLSKDPGVQAEIDAEYNEGIQSGVNQTPTLIVTVGGRRMTLPAAPNYELLKSMLDGLSKK